MVLSPLVFSLALLASACTSEDDSELEIPSRSQIWTVSMELEPDGSPLVFAQLGMIYTTDGPISEFQARYLTRNIQCLAYTRGNGEWKRHSFRNLQSPQGEYSYLLRTAKGDVRPLVRDMHNLLLYERDGAGWKVRKRVKSSTADLFGFGFIRGAEEPIPAGDDGWQKLKRSYSADPKWSRLEMAGSDSAILPLDTNMNPNSVAFLPGTDTNMMVSMMQRYDTLFTMEIRYYRWKVGAREHEVRKGILRMEDMPGGDRLMLVRVKGEARLYIPMGSGSFAEYAFRNGEFVFLGNRDTAVPQDPDKLGYFQASDRVTVDPEGCLHSLYPVLDTASRNFQSRRAYVYGSSCAEGTDTLALPDPVPGASYRTFLTDPRFAADGTVVMALSLIQEDIHVSNGEDPTPPSWLYLASRHPGGRRAWAWEKIAQF